MVFAKLFAPVNLLIEDGGLILSLVIGQTTAIGSTVTNQRVVVVTVVACTIVLVTLYGSTEAVRQIECCESACIDGQTAVPLIVSVTLKDDVAVAAPCRLCVVYRLTVAIGYDGTVSVVQVNWVNRSLCTCNIERVGIVNAVCVSVVVLYLRAC